MLPIFAIVRGETMPIEVRPMKLFYCYSHEDEKLRRELANHLSALKYSGEIATWHDGEITAGSNWSSDIMNHIDQADIVLLLVSSSFIASKYCMPVELQRAMERADANRPTVIPVILRECCWEAVFPKLQALPKNGKAVVKWPDHDIAFKLVVEGIKEAVEELRHRVRDKVEKEAKAEVRPEVQKKNPGELRRFVSPRDKPELVKEIYRKYRNAGHAFSAATKRIKEHFQKYSAEARGDRKELNAELRLLAIAMTQSWPFVSQDLPEILGRYPTATVQIKILLSDPAFIDSLKLDADYERWGQQCRQNIERLEAMVRRNPVCVQGRLSIHVKLYKQIPQWHGLLVNRTHLFLGRSKWSFDSGEPKLTVGQNFYRGYGEDNDRIALFEDWHRYYFDYLSTDAIVHPPAFRTPHFE